MSGKLFGDRYELESEVGRGGMGVVYRARDVRLGRTVALKMLPAELTRDPERRRRLAQEARAASALCHPNLATVYDYEERGEDTFIVYEFVQGATLREMLRKPRSTSEAILDIGIQLTDALAAAHEHGIVHRDLKPENIMLKHEAGRTGQVKILDFGLAKLRRPLKPALPADGAAAETATVSTAAGLLVGTVNYMAPEQLEGEPADERTDIYSLGLVLYEMATGSNPFLGKTPTSTIANILKLDAPPVRDHNPIAPPELDRILRKCLRKGREERYQSARELQVDLSNLRRDLSPGQSRSTGPAAVPAPPRPGIIPRGLARFLFAAMQAGYLVMYGLALYKWEEVISLSRRFLGGNLGEWLYALILMCALAGIPVRLYLFSALLADYADTGLKYRRLFPGALLLDLVWTLSPLLLFHKFSGLTLAFVGALAYLPFAARRLLDEVYSPGGGRASGVKSSASL